MEHKAVTSNSDRQTWHAVALERGSLQDEIVARARAAAESPWFSGHFPGEPILPGIAQLQMVYEAIQQAGGSDLKIKGIKRTRFKKVIQPEDEIKIYAGPLNDNTLSYSFRIMVKGELACSGILITERLNA